MRRIPKKHRRQRRLNGGFPVWASLSEDAPTEFENPDWLVGAD